MSAVDTWSRVANNNTLVVPDGAPNNWDGKDVNDWGREVMASLRRWYDDPEWLSVLLDATPIMNKTVVTVSPSVFRIDSTDMTAQPSSERPYFAVGRRVRMRGATTEESHVASVAVGGGGTEVTITGTNVPASIVANGIDIYINRSIDSSAFTPTVAIGDMRMTSIIPAAGPGWLVCDGQEYLITSYPALAALYGATVSVNADGYYDDHPVLGNPSTADRFRVPDMRGVVPVGYWGGAGDTDGDYIDMGFDQSGGPQNHAFYGSKKHALTLPELAAHDHGGVTLAAGIHNHGITKSGQGSSSGVVDTGAAPGATDSNAILASPSHTHVISSAGSGTAHENRPLSLVMGYLVYAGL